MLVNPEHDIRRRRTCSQNRAASRPIVWIRIASMPALHAWTRGARLGTLKAQVYGRRLFRDRMDWKPPTARLGLTAENLMPSRGQCSSTCADRQPGQSFSPVQMREPGMIVRYHADDALKLLDGIRTCSILKVAPGGFAGAIVPQLAAGCDRREAD